MKKTLPKSPLAEQENMLVPTLAVENTRPVEITPEKKQERDELSSLLLQQTEEQSRVRVEKRKQRDQEVIELVGGGTTTFGELTRLVVAKRQPYEPRFPYAIPFFSEIFRLHGWSHLDYKVYAKPKLVATWIKELIYDRFSPEVYKALRKLNPKRTGGGRANKYFQYLTPEGLLELEQYRDEAVALMQTCSTAHEFRMKMHKAYGVPYQLSIFDQPK
jgi:hypothetical protein